MKKITNLALFFLALVLPGTLAAAPKTAAERRDAYARGEAAFDAKNWEEASRIFKELWDEQRTYDVAVSLGQAEVRLNRYRDAAEHLTFALQNMPPTETLELSQKTAKALDRAKQEVGALTLLVDQPGASVRIDGKPLGTSPLPSVVFVDPGHHLIEATLSKYQPAKTEVDFNRGEAKAVTMKLEPAADAPAAPPLMPDVSTAPPTPVEPATHHGHQGKTIALIVGGTVTGIALTTTIVFAVKRSSAQSDVDKLGASIEGGPDTCNGAQPAPDCQELKKRVDDKDAAARMLNVFIPLTVVAAAGTAITYFVWPGGESHAAGRPTITPLLAQHAGGLLMSGHF
jgi:hypothetical protein